MAGVVPFYGPAGVAPRPAQLEIVWWAPKGSFSLSLRSLEKEEPGPPVNALRGCWMVVLCDWALPHRGGRWITGEKAAVVVLVLLVAGAVGMSCLPGTKPS